MSDSNYLGVNEVVPQTPTPRNLQDRTSIVPSQANGSTRPLPDPGEEYRPRPPIANAAPPAAAPPNKLALSLNHQRTGMERAASMIRAALPFVQRMLPLLDGNIGTAVSNVLTPQHPQAPPPPPVNLVPLQEGLADLRVQQRALRDQVLEQNVSLKRVEDHLQAVREATDRNTLEQQELLEDLKSVGTKVNVFAYIALALLGVSVILNVLLFLQFRHIIP